MKTKESVKVLTIHSSKGLEWKYVFLPGWVAGKVPMACFRGEKPEDHLEEERRVAFVGLTRAKKFVHISYYNRKT